MTGLPPQVKKALCALKDAGFEAYLVGGCVRDSILGKTPLDYDITTSALPDETEQVFREFKTEETGLAHGTVTVIIDGLPIEITTYRVESTYSDNRHPDAVRFTTRIEDDLARRDFTMNAIGYNPDKGMVDIFDGRKDISRGLIRCVGDADLRFKEDALRIMRALRFASVLGFDIEENTRAAAFKNKELLRNISGERLSSELIKLLCGRNARQVLTGYIEIIGVFIPELLPMVGFDQRNVHHIYDVLEHTAWVVENVPAEPTLRLATLFHDIGKPSAFSVDSSGVGHFHGHGEKGAQLTEEILTRLKIDKDTKEQVVKLVRCHDDYIECSYKAVRRVMKELTPSMFFMLLDIKRADNKAQNLKEFNHLPAYSRLERIGKDILEQEQCFNMSSLAVNGRDLMSLGFKGKEIGQMLELLLDAVINGEVQNNRKALMELLKNQSIGFS